MSRFYENYLNDYKFLVKPFRGTHPSNELSCLSSEARKGCLSPPTCHLHKPLFHYNRGHSKALFDLRALYFTTFFLEWNSRQHGNSTLLSCSPLAQKLYFGYFLKDTSRFACKLSQPSGKEN